MKTHHVALMHLSVCGRQVISTNGPAFDRYAYSRFKYGWLPPAAEYADGLVNLIADSLWQEADGRPIRLVSAPYKFLPTASHAVAEYMRDMLSEQAIERGIEPPTLLPFHKARTGSGAYAKSSAEYRRRSLETLGLHLDEDLVRDSVVVVVDDIRITGAAEEATAAYLEQLAPHAIWYVHAARLEKSAADEHPGIEDELNQSTPHSLERFRNEAFAGNFQLNTRVLRFILESDARSLGRFVQHAPSWLVKKIYDSALGCGVLYCQRHAESLQIVKNELQPKTNRRLASVST